MVNEKESQTSSSTGSGGEVPLDAIPLHSTNLLTVLDESGIIQYESPSIERIFGYGQEELVGDQVSDYFHPEDRKTVVDAFQSAVLSEEYTVETVEFRHERADGTYRWVESTTSSDPTPDGYYVVNTRDISDRKERERQLIEQNRKRRRFRRAVEAAGHAVFITDVDGTIEYTNPSFEEMTGYSAEEAIGNTPRLLKSGEMSETYYRELWETILAGDVWSEPIINRRKSGELYHASQTIAPIVEDGDVIAFVAIQTDVTERKERERKLERQNERLDRFANVVSHDLRNPLNVAQLRTDLIVADREDENAEAVQKSLSRMETMIDELLELARSGQAIETTEQCKLPALAAQSWEGVQTDGAELDVRMENETIEGDSSRLNHVFENLFRNSIEHNDPPVVIRVGLLENGNGFYVEDDGDGISEEDRDAIFEHGYTSSERGNGFGLSIVEDIVDAHGWTVIATTSSDGGARFEIRTE